MDHNDPIKDKTRADVKRCKSIDFNGEPAYVLLIHSDNPYLNKGDSYKNIIEISGAGDVDCAKLTISLPSSLVHCDRITFKINFGDEGPTEIEARLPAFATLPPLLFTNYGHRYEPTGYTTLSNLGESRRERGDQNDPILSCYFKIAKDAPEGVHKMFLNLTYKSLNSDVWYIDKQVVDIHILHWYENTQLQYIIVASLIITAVSALISIYSTFPEVILIFLAIIFVYFVEHYDKIIRS